MALDAALVIRVGSSALFVLLALVIAVVARRERPALALAFLLFTWALGTILANFTNAFLQAGEAPPRALQYASTGMVTLAAVAAFVVAFTAPRPLERRERPALAYGLAVGAVVAIVGHPSVEARLAQTADSTFGTTYPELVALSVHAGTAYTVGFVALFATSGMRAALSPPADRAGWIRAVAVAGAMAPQLILYWPTRFGYEEIHAWSSFLATLLVVLGIAIPWLVAAARTGAKPPRVVAMAAAGAGLLGYTYLLLPANDTAAYKDALGLYGIARLAGWSLLVYAILRADLLGVPLPRLAVSRGAVAAGALATLFLVAQIAQAFVDARFSLVLGSVAGTAALFVAAPLQRAREAHAESDARRREVGAALASENEDAYRRALRIALRERVVSAEEEVHLADLGERLGLRAGRARELRHEVERELAGGAR